LNSRGEVVGLNVSIILERMSMAIWMEDIQAVYEAMKKGIKK
jgi:hypothetical protein